MDEINTSHEDKNIIVKAVKEWPSKELVELYKAGGWWNDGDDESHIKEIISGSFVFMVAVNSATGEAVGMGRILSDGVADAYIQDVIVLPEYRHKGVGRKIIKSLVKYCINKKIRWIALIAEEGTADFYSSLGFHVMKKHTPMKYSEQNLK